MRDPISIRTFMAAIRALRADRPVSNRRKWYLTQKEHWLGWLSEYGGPGAYGRQTGVKRDARFAYMHIVEPAMLMYLARASGVDRKLLGAAVRASTRCATLNAKSGAIRAFIPWETVAAALWRSYLSPQKGERSRRG